MSDQPPEGYKYFSNPKLLQLIDLKINQINNTVNWGDIVKKCEDKTLMIVLDNVHEFIPLSFKDSKLIRLTEWRSPTSMAAMSLLVFSSILMGKLMFDKIFYGDLVFFQGERLIRDKAIWDKLLEALILAGIAPSSTKGAEVPKKE